MISSPIGGSETEKQISLEFQEHLPTGNSPNDEGCLVVPSSSSHGVSEKSAKRRTRQWAAWTREEEESFFTALRQVGKNFEKITCHVQSKNKDQVRHYYYRLVRRMNKLLGPGFSLDAKNSKDTNAAMLRWWSLLEKYSCKASKLHLKPRRFKIFIEALEHQLLKARKKNARRRSSLGENRPPLCPTPFAQQNKPSVNETRAVKFVLVESQNIQKAGCGKGSMVRRNSNIGVNKSNNKGDSSPTKASRQRRRAAAIKKWEKATIDAVSLVADAAEHLERMASAKEPETFSALTSSSLQAAACSKEEGCLRPSEVVLPPLPNIFINVPPESSSQYCGKLKLQLFPIDDVTKRALEMDKRNPYLELTLSTRKKITSVIEHLNKKWGSSSVACGELMLFPYSVQRENVLMYQRWTRESFVTAADVYAMIGNPPVFQLRYCWISPTEFQSAMSTPPSVISDKSDVHEYSGKKLLDDPTPTLRPWSNTMDEPESPGEGKEASSSHSHAAEQPMNDSPDDSTGYAASDPENDVLDLSGFVANTLCQRSMACIGTTRRETENTGVCNNNSAMSAGEWADSLTNISGGDLLNEVTDVDDDCDEAPLTGSSPCLEEIPCDSFDAAVAAHILCHQNKRDFHLALTSYSSILDAEETCNAFSFQKRSLNSQQAQSSSMAASSPACKDTVSPNSAGSGGFLEDLLKGDEMMDATTHGDPMEEGPSPNLTENSSKDLNTLTDMYWPDSLGPLDLDAPSCRYYSQDLFLSDSLSGLSHLIASSLDAFQNCSFFSLEKKETTAVTEAQGKASSAEQD